MAICIRPLLLIGAYDKPAAPPVLVAELPVLVAELLPVAELDALLMFCTNPDCLAEETELDPVATLRPDSVLEDLSVEEEPF